MMISNNILIDMMNETLKKIFNKYNILLCEPIKKGWSKDQKYLLTASNNEKYVLRITNMELYEKKKSQYLLLKNLNNLDINASVPIDFDILDEKNCYMLLTYLEGMDAEVAVSKMSNIDAYKLGTTAGIILKKLHSIPVNEPHQSWWEKYQAKMPIKINNLLNCKYQLPMQDKLINYYKSHIYLMQNRGQRFSHGDYHLGNMIVQDGKIGIIDFDKNTIADPYDEFKPYCWNTLKSEYFETGLINGYFDNKIPDDFFKILKFYAVEWMISHLPWATNYGEEDVKKASKINEYQMKWWDNFELDIPLWYKGII